MKFNFKENVFLVFVVGLLIGAIAQVVAPNLMIREMPTYKVIDATRLDDCTYQVGLEDRSGDQFSLTQDLVKFAAMGVNVNDILIFGEL